MLYTSDIDKFGVWFFDLEAKLVIFIHTSNNVKIFSVTLPSEADEEAGSAEEQPASNRLLRHTGIVGL